MRFVTAAALLLLTPALATAAVTRNFVEKANWNEWPPTPLSPFGAGYSACWSYIHGDGREYAILGTTGGTAIYNVTNVDATYRVGFIPGPSSAWREMKSYRNWIYIVTEATGTGQGIQIVSMVNPESPALVNTWTGSFTHSHTVSVDTTRAILICNGTRNAAGQQTGMRVLSIANPTAPVEIGWWPGGAIPVPTDEYVHDSVPIGNRLYAASIYAGIERILDFTNPAAPVELSSWTYPGGFSHNSWPDATGHWLYVTDEVNGEPLKIFDITNPSAPVLANTITSNPSAIVHNAHVRGNELYISNYTEGIRVLDLSDPRHPAEFGWADSYSGPSGGFYGVWEVCPFFPSGTVVASDMQTGLYVYRPVRDYGLVRAEVTDASTSLPAAGVQVNVPTDGDSLRTGPDGVAVFAPNPGVHTVRSAEFGYSSDSKQVTVGLGDRDTVRLSIAPRPRRDLAGTILDAGTLAGLEDSEFELESTPVHAHGDVSGHFTCAQLPEDVYQASARAAGHIPAEFELSFLEFSPSTMEFRLPAAPTWDKLESASGWVVGAAGDNATTGIWVRVEPFGTGGPQGGARNAAGSPRDAAEWKPGPTPLHEGHETDGMVPGDVQPETDHTPGIATMCFVTGQGTTTDPGQADVDDGKTTLTSPALNLTGMTDPVIGFWRWFYGSGSSDDYLAISISNDNGATWTTVETVHGFHNHWEEDAIHVKDFVTPTANVKVRFVAADENPGSIVEAAIDDVVTYDGVNAPVVGVHPPPDAALLRFRTVFPNPARGNVRMVLELPTSGEISVDVVDLQGRRVTSLARGTQERGFVTLIWTGRDAAGHPAPAGLYFVRARTAAGTTTARVVRSG